MRKVAIVVGIVLVVLCGGVGWFAWQAYDLGRQLVDASITQQQFDAQKEGTAEADVRAALPAPLSGLQDTDLYGDDPAKQGMPAGASCVYYGVKPLQDAGEQPMWRLCFVGGTLAEKSRITLPE
ncbi:hypothetical protein J2S43_004635 [Catenuloplanes nepalensis]|uniref:Uncharacterized protein n=1 Tax=Catenuloplanes nepalensis TaxID=587533 RepID=A0ABT9MXH0_9ACTN|nr:hypothetical protein [Catenuloplanes nepalensis]MDP9796123.1 hypothetical protein [Catenuloplanes nepalensis]